MNRKVHIVIPLSLVFILIVCQVNAQKNERLGGSYYGGLDRNIVHGSGYYAVDPNQKDSPFPYSDTIRYIPSVGFHFGGGISYEFFKNTFIQAGLSLNFRRKKIKLFGDSTNLDGTPLPAYNMIIYPSYNFELPILISYTTSRINFGCGVSILLLELSMKKYYKDQEIVTKIFSKGYIPKLQSDRFLFPRLFTEVLLTSIKTYPLWLHVSYEFGNNYQSAIYVSLKTIFN